MKLLPIIAIAILLGLYVIYDARNARNANVSHVNDQVVTAFVALSEKNTKAFQGTGEPDSRVTDLAIVDIGKMSYEDQKELVYDKYNKAVDSGLELPQLYEDGYNPVAPIWKKIPGMK